MTARLPPKPQAASASFPFVASFLPLALAFTENAASAFVFSGKDVSRLVLAVEEVYSFYLDPLADAAVIDLALTNERYRLRLDINFRMTKPRLRAFNLTYRVDPDDEGSLSGLGLMIAARSVTRLSIELGRGEQVGLQLVREREYPPAVLQTRPAAPPPTAAVRLAVPSREELLYFGGLLATDRDAPLPAFLERPAMAADMLAGGALDGLLASSGQALSGGVFWQRLCESTIELYGPYLLYPDTDDALLARLLDEAIGRISRSGARTLLRRQGALRGYAGFFDFLGELELAGSAADERVVWPHYYKQLREESGGVVYAEPRFADFLRAEYDRLFLPRQVRETSAQAGNSDGEDSVLGVDFEPRRSLATLRLLADGSDLADNLAAHLALLAREGLANVLAEVDCGRGEEIAFVVALYDAGFQPRLLIPDAGRGDLVVFSR